MVAEVLGFVEEVAECFELLFVPLNFFVMRSALCDAIIGCMTLDFLQVNLDYALQQATLAVLKREVLLTLLSKPPVVDETCTDSEDFTSP